ncbi:MAG: hypothetical protein KF847_09225 [Pirellulales bacterium]|nr:hypothetical protein [Pirellulales bacterium]
MASGRSVRFLSYPACLLLLLPAVPGQGAGVIDVSGAVPAVILQGNQTARVLPTADVAFLDAFGASRVEVLGGEISFLQLHEQSQAIIRGGFISFVFAADSSRAEFHGVDDLSWLFLRPGAEAHVYGRNFEYSSGHLHGIWANDTAFSFWALFEEAPGVPPVIGPMPAGLHLHTIPEPTAGATGAVLTVAMLYGRRWRRRCSRAGPGRLASGGPGGTADATIAS